MIEEKEYLALFSKEKKTEDKPNLEGLVGTDFIEIEPTPSELQEIPEEPWREDPSERGKIENESETDMDPPAENVKEREFVEDPVRMYLHEIGQVQLLTAANEKYLAKTIEQGKYISNIKQGWLVQYGSQPLSTDVIMIILQNLGKSGDLVQLVQEQAGLPVTNSFYEALSSTRLCETLDRVESRGLCEISLD